MPRLAPWLLATFVIVTAGTWTIESVGLPPYGTRDITSGSR